jgi:5-methylcytosine-specific restriction endonuclease McrA
MTEQKLSMLELELIASWHKEELVYPKQRQSGFYLCRLGGLPAMNSHTKFDRVVRTYGYKCSKCNTVNPHLTIDHKLSKVRGGTSDTDNLQLLCLEDHRRKDNKLKKKRRCRDAIAYAIQYRII